MASTTQLAIIAGIIVIIFISIIYLIVRYATKEPTPTKVQTLDDIQELSYGPAVKLCSYNLKAKYCKCMGEKAKSCKYKDVCGYGTLGSEYNKIMQGAIANANCNLEEYEAFHGLMDCGNKTFLNCEDIGGELSSEEIKKKLDEFGQISYHD